MQCAGQRKPSGYVEAPPPTSGSGNSKPPPEPPVHLIALNLSTIVKLTVPTIAAVLAAIMFYARTITHIENQEIHVRSESKADAKESRKEMIKVIFAKHDVAVQRVEVKQEEAIQKLSARIDDNQRKVLAAIRKRGRR